MKRTKEIFNQLALEDIQSAIRRAAKEHMRKRDVAMFLKSIEQNATWLYESIKNGSYTQLISYRQLQKTGNNGKLRHIDSPDFVTRVLQYVFLAVAEKLHQRVDPMVGLNCKKGCGITAKKRKQSVVKRVKHLFYDCRQYSFAVVADQRQCYAHIKPCVFRRALRRLVDDEAFVDFAEAVCFCGGRLPIGTPVSPMVHHIIMLPFDLWVKQESRLAVRYADDVLVPCESRAAAQQMKWRIKNYWWYVLGVRAKRGVTRVVNLDEPLDFCGYVFHRNAGKSIPCQNKGYTTIRKSTFRRAKKATNKNCGSYFGIMQHADTFGAMARIEAVMDLRRLTDTIRIERKLDAPTIPVRELEEAGIVFTIYDYEMRVDSKKRPNWIKCLIGYPELDKNGRPTGREIAREFHGSYQGIVDFHTALEAHYPKSELLPLTNCQIVGSCGYIYKDSTNQIQFIDDYERSIED